MWQPKMPGTQRRESNDRQMTEAELEAKFSYLVALPAVEAKARELARVLNQLDTVSNISG